MWVGILKQTSDLFERQDKESTYTDEQETISTYSSSDFRPTEFAIVSYKTTIEIRNNSHFMFHDASNNLHWPL